MEQALMHEDFHLPELVLDARGLSRAQDSCEVVRVSCEAARARADGSSCCQMLLPPAGGVEDIEGGVMSIAPSHSPPPLLPSSVPASRLQKRFWRLCCKMGPSPAGGGTTSVEMRSHVREGESEREAACYPGKQDTC